MYATGPRAATRNFKLDATQDQMARIRTNRCAAYPGWQVSTLGSVPPLPGVVQKRDHCHTHLDGLAGLAKRVTISLLPGTGVSWKEWLEDMVVQDTGSVGG